jgi:hypothetical protein
MALRPRFSTGLPLSNEQNDKVPKKRAWQMTRLAKNIQIIFIFGNLAIVPHQDWSSISPMQF